MGVRDHTIFKAGLLYFGTVFGVGFLLGIIRTLWIAPRFGTRAAELIESPFMLVVIICSARWILRRGVIASRRFDLLKVGFIALAMILVAEFTFVLLLRGISIADYFAERDPIAGTVYYIMLMAFALMPIFVCQEAREHAHPSKLFKNTPVAYANPAAIVPTARVEKPERHHDEVDHRLLTEPIVKNTPPVMIIERATGLCSPNK